MTRFETAALDLDAYFSRIGYRGAARPDEQTLAEVARLHPLAIPFENLDPLLRRPVALDVRSLVQKLVHGGRGGWCFEQNVLLGTVLRALGYEVTGLAARVMWNAPPGAEPPRSHMVLRVDLGDRPFIVDAGFGGLTLTGPLRLETGIEQQTPHETFRLRRWETDELPTANLQTPNRNTELPTADFQPAVSDPTGASMQNRLGVGSGDLGVGEAAPTFVLEARLGEGWRPLYRFDLQPQLLADYQVTNWYLCHAPTSHFLSTLVVARSDADRRFNLRNTELAIRHRDGSTERRVFATVPALRDALEQVFGLAVPRGDALDDALARIIATAPPVAPA